MEDEPLSVEFWLSWEVMNFLHMLDILGESVNGLWKGLGEGGGERLGVVKSLFDDALLCCRPVVGVEDCGE